MPLVPAILAAIIELLGLNQLITSLLKQLGIIQDETLNAANAALKQAADARTALYSGTYGLSVLHTQLISIINTLDGINAPVLSAIAALPAGSDIVIPSTGDNAEAVWEYVLAQQMANGYTYNLMAQEWLYAVAHRLAIDSATEGVADNRQPWYRLVFGGVATAMSIGYTPSITNQTRPAAPDFTQLLADDTMLSFMQRTQPSAGWTGQGPSGTPQTAIAWIYLYGSPMGVWWRTAFDLPAIPLPKGAPIWPGLAGVTLLEPTVLTETGIVTTSMEGILLTVDSGPGGAGQWGVGDFRSYYRAGYVVFLDADGHADTTQFVGPDDNVFAPKGMATAASVVIGLNKATQITVTPWILGVAEG
jgi:hypothetical protein